MALQLPPLSLYVHIPWCVRKCPYCDFNSHAAGDGLPEDAYVAALLADLEADLPWAAGRELQSVFFGGGTPSLFSPRAIGAILAGAERRLGFAADIEITLEANPGTVEQQKFAGYRAAGVNRLSIGVQSFQPAQLAALGRIHSGAEAVRAAESARRAGIDNFNLDLMHGLPGQDVAGALADLRQAVALAPAHLSWYQLTIEPNTEYFRRPPQLPEEDALADIQDAGEALLAAEGYAQYEISGYARPGRACRHNLNYWRFGDYLGIGAGAHGKLSLPGEDRILRTHKTRLPGHYLQRQGDWRAGVEQVEREARPLEFMMNALRLNAGVERALFEARTGLPLAGIAPALAALEAEGLLLPGERLQCSDTGRRFLQEVLARF